MMRFAVGHQVAFGFVLIARPSFATSADLHAIEVRNSIVDVVFQEGGDPAEIRDLASECGPRVFPADALHRLSDCSSYLEATVREAANIPDNTGELEQSLRFAEVCVVGTEAA